MPKKTAGAAEDDAAARRNLEEVKRPLQAFVKAKKLHESKVRDLVVDAFLSAHDHMGLEDILEKVRVKNPSVGMTTVYRTMKLLEEAGLAQARDFGSGETLYEISLGRPHHDHLVCETCGRIIEFVSEEIESQQEKVAAKHGFELRRHRHELFGVCDKCRRARG
jgi:Fur family transcriptional regulator, ferric uptake regulator